MSNLIIIVLIIISLFLQGKLWLKADGIYGIINLNKIIKQQEKEVEDLQDRNTKLLNMVRLLKRNPSALEEYARVNFGMIKKDEIYYRIID